MLSSLFPRGSVYANLDAANDDKGGDDAATIFDEAAEDQQDGLDDDDSNDVHDHVPDPFEPQPQPATATSTMRMLQDPFQAEPEQRSISDNAPSLSRTRIGDAVQTSIAGETSAGQLSHRRVQQQQEQHRQPPMSIMFEEQAIPPSPFDQSPWQKPGLGDHSQALPGLPESSSRDDRNNSFNANVTAPPSELSTSPYKSPVSTASNPIERSQQVPWWLRESRRHLSPGSLRQSIPLDSRIELGEPERQRYDSAESRSETAYTSTRHTPNLVQAATNALMSGSRRGPIRLSTKLSPKERALWLWANVQDLDAFLQEVYTFYVRKGMWSILLSNFLDLLTIGFVIAFSTFLLGCVDYSAIRGSHSLGEVLVDRCVSRFHGTTLLLVLVCSGFYALRIIEFGNTVKQLIEMRNFFTEALDVPEADIATVAWPTIVDRIAKLRAAHPSHPSADITEAGNGKEPRKTDRLDAHDIANRIMRKENYLIALFNKSVLHLAVPIPQAFLQSRSITFLLDKAGIDYTTLDDAARPARTELATLSKSLEWNLSFCLMGFLFGPDGQVRRAFMQESSKADLIFALQRRFILMGCINAIFAPFIVLYLLFYSFFRYFEEYHKNPSSIGNRSYTQLARWKFREFNELPHIFTQRLHRSYALAGTYINQFPNDRTAQIARFVAFVSGSFASVLVLLSLLDPDAFLHFEITKDRSVLFYITVFGSILAVARGMVPDDHRVVDPEELMKAVIEGTHYLPADWRGHLHSARVHREFSKLFPLKITIFLQELLSVITTPLVLWFTLPRCAPAIVDFFREFTIHVDGIGHVCSFAVFDFKRHGDVRFGAPVQADKEHLVSEQGKLEKSVLGFKAANPNWQPDDQATSMYLSRMTEMAASIAPSDQHGFRQGHSRQTRQKPDARASGSTHMGRQRLRSRTVARRGSPIQEEEDGNGSDRSASSEMSPQNALAGIATDVSSPISAVSALPDPNPSLVGLLYEGTRQRQQQFR